MPLPSEKREYSNVIMWKWAYFFGGWGECIGGMIQKRVIRRPQGIFFSVIKGTPGYVHVTVDKKVLVKFMDSK